MSDDDVRAGDVLLFHGRGFISWAIRKIDGTDVNHAALALSGEVIGEAGGRGLQMTPLDRAIASNDCTVVKRFDGPQADDVVAVANTYLSNGRPYAYQQIVLLAILASTRRIPLTGIGRRFVRSALDHGAAALNAFIDHGGTRSMICSEFVYRCYEEAPGGPPPPFHLGVLLGDVAFGPGPGSVVDWALAVPDAEIPDLAPVSFGPGPLDPIDPEQADERAEAELAPLIAAYAAETGWADDDVPSDVVAVPFDLGVADVSDEELLTSMVGFGTALSDARTGTPASFGIGTIIGGAVAKGAIEGILRVSVEPNFVTPGDLLRSPSLRDVARVPAA